MRYLKTTRIGIAEAAVILAVLGLLVVTVVWAASAWSIGNDIEMGKHGSIALGLGTFFSLLIGCGLMTLMFYSSRSGHDDAADPFRHKEGQHVDRAQNDNDR